MRDVTEVISKLKALNPSDIEVLNVVNEAIDFLEAREAEEVRLAEWRRKNSDEAMSKGWRGRRLVACRAQSKMQAVIENLGADDGANLPPEHGLPTVTPQTINELRNLSAVLLRMVLAANDGGMSAARLNTF